MYPFLSDFSMSKSIQCDVPLVKTFLYFLVLLLQKRILMDILIFIIQYFMEDRNMSDDLQKWEYTTIKNEQKNGILKEHRYDTELEQMNILGKKGWKAEISILNGTEPVFVRPIKKQDDQGYSR